MRSGGYTSWGKLRGAEWSNDKWYRWGPATSTRSAVLAAFLRPNNYLICFFPRSSPRGGIVMFDIPSFGAPLPRVPYGACLHKSFLFSYFHFNLLFLFPFSNEYHCFLFVDSKKPNER